MNTASTLIEWYLRHKRDLPWRHTSDPYAIWLSEVILQQTRVDQGLAYYFRFLEKFPTVDHLAAASEDEVLKLWQGLGYYSRARNLRATAMIVSEVHIGKFPSTYEKLITLKGIGPYTAAAIASFAFGEKRAVVDGNVIRVLGRLFGIAEPYDTASGKKCYQLLADELIPEHDPGRFNQSIMEFGAICCTPRQPKCAECPFSQSCVARLSNKVSEFPVKSRKTAVQEVWYYYVVPDYREQTYVRRRSHNGIWKGLHDFPCVESNAPLTPAEVRKAFAEQLQLLIAAPALKRPVEMQHILSHRKIHAVFYRVSEKIMWKNMPEEYHQISWEDLRELGVPRLIDRYLMG